MPEVAPVRQDNGNENKHKDTSKVVGCLNDLENTKASAGFARANQDGLDSEDCHVPFESQQYDFGPQLKIIRMNDQVKELQTVLRDKTTIRSDFVFYADRLIRLVVEEALNQLPYKSCIVKTPTGSKYNGLAFKRGNCGVSIMRSGEAMEKGLRDCCRSIRIGKILIKSSEESQTPKVYYAKFPADVDQRKVLLMYPLLNSGATVITALNVLREHGVKDENVIMLTVFATPQGVTTVLEQFPTITILTSEVHSDCPSFFGQKYFGTE